MSAKRICPACHKPFKVGVHVLFQARTGSRPATVCKRCAKRGTIIVPDHTGDMHKCTVCETRGAVFCSLCATPRQQVLPKVHANGGAL